MRGEINQGIVVVLRTFIADQKSGVSSFIADQVKGWDMQQLIGVIEVNIGRDLQYIRFNGFADRRARRAGALHDRISVATAVRAVPHCGSEAPEGVSGCA